MINVTCTLADSIRIRLTADGRFSICMQGRVIERSEEPERLLNAADNLATRAVRSFAHEFGFNFGADIEIHKEIPPGAGLGGGSSDAAAVLLFLARECGIHESPEGAQRLNRIALALGADVPYLLSGKPALVSGVGDQVQELPLDFLTGHPLALILPESGVDTSRIYARLRQVDLEDLSVDGACERFLAQLQAGGVTDIAQVLKQIDNDLLPYALIEQPDLNLLNQSLSKNPDWVASMSGSGSSFFVIPRQRCSSQHLRAGVIEALAGLDLDVRIVEIR